MPEYRRNYVPGGTYFFTVVTQDRRPILTSELGRNCLREALTAVQASHAFNVLAIALLSDHLHSIWTLPPNDSDFSLRWAQIKERFTRSFLAAGGAEGTRTNSRKQHRERGVWQKRFWEHTCRDEDDLKRFLDYLHWNPVKHGYVKHVADYPWSTFHRFVEMGEYDREWGQADPWPEYEAPEWE